MALATNHYVSGPYSFTLEVDQVADRLEVTGVVLHNPDGIRWTYLRRLAFSLVARSLLSDLQHRWGPLIAANAHGPEAQAVARALQTASAPRRGRPVLYPPEHWAEVARVYEGAAERPVCTVADWFHVSRSTARKWVERCRAKGLI